MNASSITQTRIDEAWLEPRSKSRAPRDPRVKVGRLLAGRFRVEGMLGVGGMGEVFEAYDQVLDERVAVKVVRPSETDAEVSSLRLRLEVQLARRVTHANVCRIFDLFQEPAADGLPALDLVSMELLQGETLAQRLKSQGRMELEEALPLVRQIARGLHAAHRTGIVHRDLKPGNVMLVPEVGGVRVAITDFGLARREAQRKRDPEAGLQETVAGTPAYMAPEQISGEALSPSTDIYSLGIIFYESLAGILPFAGTSAWEMSVKRLTESPKPLSDSVSELDPRVYEIIDRCLMREPGDRFRDTSELLENLDFGDPSWNPYGLKGASDIYPRPEGLPARADITASSARGWISVLAASLTIVVLSSFVPSTGADRSIVPGVPVELGPDRAGEDAIIGEAEGGDREALPFLAIAPSERTIALLQPKDPRSQAEGRDPFLREALSRALWDPSEKVEDTEAVQAALGTYHLGRIRQDQGEFEEAIVLLREGYGKLEAAGDLRSGNLARIELALLLEELGRIDDMLVVLPEEESPSSILEPRISGMVLAARASGLIQAGRAWEAAAVMDRASSLKTDGSLAADLRRLAAETALVQGRSREALHLADELGIAFAAGRISAGALAHTGRHEEALARLEEDATFDGLILRGELLWRAGKIGAAREVLDRAREMVSDGPWVREHWRLGILESRLRSMDQAEAAARQLTSILNQALALGHLQIASEARVAHGELTRDPEVLRAAAAESRRHGFRARAAQAKHLLESL